LNAYQDKGKPIVLVYRRIKKLLIDSDAPDAEEKLQQRKKLKAFFDGCKNPDGSHRDGLNDYDTPAQFKELLARHLAAKIHSRLTDSTAHQPGDPHPKPAKPGPTWDIATLGPPYRGLQALTDKHADLFFGRKEELNQLAAKLAGQRFVVVVGASGAGKSSLVWAGLLPKLDHWLWVRMTPAENKDDEDFAPVKVLAEVLAKTLGQRYSLVKKALQVGGAELQQLLDAMTTQPAGQLLVFVDQFEELFSLVAPPLRKPFINALDGLMATGKVRVVATMRAEFLGQCMDCEEFGKHLADWFNAGQLLLAAPDAEDLHPMVEGPAQLAGLAFEARLANQIVKDTGLKPGNLALMAFALERLYEQRQGQLMTWQAYQDFGGIDGAIADKADQVFKTSMAQGSASPEALSSPLGDVFRELVEIDEHSGAATRRRVPLSVWGLGHDHRGPTTPAQRLMDDFISARLLLTDGAIEGEREPTLEVAHEALFRNWPLLKGWIDARKDQFLMRKRLQRDAAEWARRGELDAFRWLDPLALEAGGMIRALRYQATEREARFLGPVQREEMLRLIQVADTSHELRATLGVRLAWLGDDRPGVGVKDGLPDIV
ncbi:MAG: ATP-binding protein, partial [Candidatus Methylumidiphilus sp.]